MSRYLLYAQLLSSCYDRAPESFRVRDRAAAVREISAGEEYKTAQPGSEETTLTVYNVLKKTKMCQV